MTYTLFECLKEHLVDILSEQADEVIISSRVEKIDIEDQVSTSYNIFFFLVLQYRIILIIAMLMS